jgi:type I restriction enzyme R subunit
VDGRSDVDDARLAAEQRARVLIDSQLTAAGWQVQDRRELNLFAAQGVAVREVVMAPGHGRVDYLLYVDKRVVGVVEAKPEGTSLSGVEWQSAMYATGLPPEHEKRAVVRDGRLPFVLEVSGSETHLTNGLDPLPRARRFFGFPQPATLARWLRDAEADPDRPTWRAKVRDLPPLAHEGLRPAQITAIAGVERSLAEGRHERSLVQMATGAGKTYTAVSECYRLLKHGGMRRILFLVDRTNLGEQTRGEFEGFVTPDDGRKFPSLYPVDMLTAAGMLDSTSVVISTIQRVHAVLSGRTTTADDDPELDRYVPDSPVEVPYSAAMPPESFDLVIVDECHRSIYGVWRGVLEYFDAHLLGLTATPVKQTFGFFRQNLVSEYTYAESVVDGVNVDFDVFRIATEITENGSSVEAGNVVPVMDRRTRRQRYQELDEDLTYGGTQLDRAVTSPAQVRLVLETFRDRLPTDIFPGRSEVPKTLIFCKDDAHAELVVSTAREVFGRGNDFAVKITYNASKPRELIKAFRTSPTMRIAVTVDMIATGTDIKPLECVLFLRDVRSATYFEQMKGRGARTIDPTDFQAVTPDAATKDRFVIVDAVAVTEHDFVDATPLQRDRSVSLQKLLQKAAALTLTGDEVATLASRLARLDQQLTDDERAELAGLAGQSLRAITRGLVEAVDPDRQALAVEAAPAESSESVVEAMLETAVEPLAANAPLRERILEIRRSHDLYIDDVSADRLLRAEGVVDTGRARSVVESWKQYVLDHRDEITGWQVLYDATPTGRVDYSALRELAERIKRPPYGWTPDLLWTAYESLEVGRVKHSSRHTVTDLIRLVRFTLGLEDELVPYASVVAERYAAWLASQSQAGASFTDDQRWWLDRMAETIAESAGVTADDLDAAPFTERGGVDGALRELGPGVVEILASMNAELTA